MQKNDRGVINNVLLYQELSTNFNKFLSVFFFSNEIELEIKAKMPFTYHLDSISLCTYSMKYSLLGFLY